MVECSLEEVRPSKERSDEQAAPHLVTKTVRVRTSTQDASPP